MSVEENDAFLLKLAEAEILGEAKKAKIRHSLVGPSGWQPAPKTNKSFFVNTLLQILSSNRVLESKQGSLLKGKQCNKKKRKLYQKNKNNGLKDILYQKPNKNNISHKTQKPEQEKSEKCKQVNDK